MYHIIGRVIYGGLIAISLMLFFREDASWLMAVINPLDLLIAWQGALLTFFLMVWLSYFAHNAIIADIMSGNWKYVESDKPFTTGYLYFMIISAASRLVKSWCFKTPLIILESAWFMAQP